MKEETAILGKMEKERETPVSHPEQAPFVAPDTKEIQQILKDNQDAKERLAMVLEASGLSREAAARLLHLDIS